MPIANLTLERVRRLDKKLDRVLHIVERFRGKRSTLCSIWRPGPARISLAMKLYWAQYDALSRIAKHVEHIKKRLDLVDA
jgi:hypothetical protein